MSDLANLSLVSDSETETREPSCKKQAKSDSPADAKRRKILDDRLHLRQSNNEVENSTEKTKMQKQSTESAGQSSEEIQILEKVEDTALNINALPPEILVKILSYIRQEELLKFARVCKRWYKITKCDVLWKKVDIKFTKKAECRNKHKNISVERFFYSLPSCVVGMKLDFSSLKKHPHLSFVLRMLQMKCINLQTLILHDIETLISISRVRALCADVLPNLRILAFCNSDLACVPFYDCKYESMSKVFVSKLEILDLCHCNSVIFNTSDYKKMPYLRKLYLAHTALRDFNYYQTLPMIESYTPFYRNLRVLDVGHTITGHTVFRNIRDFGHNLNEIYLCSTDISDDDLVSLESLNAFPQLKIICLNSCESVTYIGILSLIQSCPSLDHIYVDESVDECIPISPQNCDIMSKLEIIKVKYSSCFHYDERNYLI